MKGKNARGNKQARGGDDTGKTPTERQEDRKVHVLFFSLYDKDGCHVIATAGARDRGKGSDAHPRRTDDKTMKAAGLCHSRT